MGVMAEGPFVDAGGVPVGAEEARVDRAESEESLRALSEVLGVVAHDLRNPLNAIALSAELLARRYRDPDIEAIQEAVHRANRLVQDLLTAAVVQGGALPLVRSAEPLGLLLEDAVAVHRPAARAKAIRLATDVAEPERVVRVDRHRIVQMLGNLVGNALRFTDDGGRIDVSARPLGSALELAVADTGCGIPSWELPFVFDRFWQGARCAGGSAGLGLAIARGIAEAHGGSIHVESEVGRGTTLRVLLPPH